MESTFDPKKNAANLRKHGVSLSEGDGVLNDPLALTVEDASSAAEQRFVSIGTNVLGQLRVVVYTYRGELRAHHLGAKAGAQRGPSV